MTEPGAAEQGFSASNSGEVAPRATYRIQLSPRFGFRALEAQVPYLARLGISHVYVSPCLEAVPGSSHG